MTKKYKKAKFFEMSKRNCIGMSDEEFIKKREIAINDKGFPKLDIPLVRATKLTKRRKNGYA